MNNYKALLEQVKLIVNQNNTLVDENYVLRAQYFVHRRSIQNIDDAFLVFASFNYLNFAVKQEGYKKLISYSFKSKLSDAVRICKEKNLPIKFNVEVDKSMPILYVSFEDFIFSFHNVTIDADLKATLNDHIDFDFVYKQLAAHFILKEAMKSDSLTLDLSRLAKSKLED